MRQTSLVCLLVAAALALAGRFPAEALELEKVGWISADYVGHIAVQGQHVFRTTRDAMGGGKLLIHDCSDPANPKLAATANIGSVVHSIAVSDKVAVVGAWGLRVLDISDPAAPVDHGNSMLAPNPFGLALFGDTLYVGDLNDGLLVVDLSNPAAPTVLGQLDLPSGTVGLAVSPPYAVLLDWYGRLRIVDASDLSAPKQVALWQPQGSIEQMAAAGSYLFAVGDRELRIVDISTPSSLEERTVYQFDREVTGIALGADRAFVSLSYPNAIGVLDITDPLRPLLAGYLSLSWGVWDLAASADWAVVTGSEGQLLTIDATSLQVLGEAPGLATRVFGYRVTVWGDHGYVTAGWNSDGAGGLSVVNAANPAAPAKVAELSWAGPVASVIASEGRLYLAHVGEASLSVYDLAQPDLPEETGFLAWASGNPLLALRGDHVYVCTDGDLRVVDVSDPAAPVQVGSYGPLSDVGHSIAASGNHVFIAGPAGLLSFDVSDPAQPRLVGALALAAPAGEVAVSGSLAFVATGSAGIRIVDISDPTALEEVDMLPEPATEVTAYGSFLYTNAGVLGLSQLLAGAPTGEEALVSSRYAFAGPYVFHAADAAGLVVYRARMVFSDTPLDHWALDAIERCAAWEIVVGYPDGGYHPADCVSRDQMAVYIARALLGGEAGVPTGPAEPTFGDVGTGHWAYKHIEWAVANGIVQGYKDHTYQPAAQLDRAQMAVFIARSTATPFGEEGLAGYVPPETPSFPDADTGFWAYKHIEYIRSHGLISGYLDRLYHPERICTRDQMAVFIARAFARPQ